jgi:hypothetical protein
MSNALQIFGAALVLTAFLGVQRGVIDPRSMPSLILNFAGSAVLAALALIGHQWGFLLLEGSWASVSLAGIGSRARSRSDR